MAKGASLRDRALSPAATEPKVSAHSGDDRLRGFFYVEWTGKPCPFCGENGVSGKTPEGFVFAGCPDADCLAHQIAFDFITVDHARAAWDRRANKGNDQ